MFRKPSSLVLLASCLLTPAAARAAVIATYYFPGSDPAGDATVPSAPHATLSPVTRVGLDAVPRYNGFASADYTPSSCLDPRDSYVEFSITADPGYLLNLDSLTFYFTRADQNASRTGPKNGAVRASFESFLDGSGTGDEFAPKTTEQHTTWDFTDYTGESATFRIYAWNATGGSDPNHYMQLIIDDIYINGTITPITPNPEPSTLFLLLPLAPLAAARRPRP
jgi:hypothetical protein